MLSMFHQLNRPIFLRNSTPCSPKAGHPHPKGVSGTVASYCTDRQSPIQSASIATRNPFKVGKQAQAIVADASTVAANARSKIGTGSSAAAFDTVGGTTVSN
jgi:hypothetical protein